jgi:hypothetical protein
MTDEAASYRGEGDHVNPPPHHYPRGKPQAATNFSKTELKLLHFSWPRPLQEPYHTYRLRVSGVICDVLNKVLVNGSLPSAMLDYLATPLIKRGPPGGIVDFSSPNNYRLITMSPLLTKILALVLDARLLHWVSRGGNAIVSIASQGAFIPLLSTDWHVLALTESIKAQWRSKNDAYVAFVDFSKAYDAVHPLALLAVLRRHGLPGKLLDLLDSWLLNRTTSVRVNGSTSPPISNPMGVGQGDVHSCILFVIFINSLSNYLIAHRHTLGLNNDGVLLIHFAFADDVAAPAAHYTALEKHLRLIHKWATDWGLTINVGPHKTAAMFFRRPHRAALRLCGDDPPNISFTDGTIIPWVTSYRYLGFPITPSLSMEPLLHDIKQRIALASSKYFGYNSATGMLNNAGIAQLLKGSFSPYLLSLVPTTQKNIDSLQTSLLKLSRFLTHLPAQFADNDTVNLEAGIPSALFCIIRSRLSTLLSLAITPHQSSPAARTIRAFNGPTTPSATGPWLSETVKFLNSFSQIGAGNYNDVRALLNLNRDPRPSDIPRASLVFSRRACATFLLHHRPTPPPNGYVTLASQRIPRFVGPTLHALSFNFSHEHGIDKLGNLAFTPLSCRSHMASGALIFRTTVPLSRAHLDAVMHLRLGAIALSLAPLGPLCWRTISNYRNGARPTQAWDAAPRISDAGWSTLKRGRECPFCPGHPADPSHIIFECTEPTVRLARTSTRASASAFIPKLLARLASASSSNSHLLQAGFNNPPGGSWALPPGALETINWDSPTNGTLLLRLLSASPWHASCVDDQSELVMSHLGHCFDALLISNTDSHPIANSWVPFAARATTRLFRAYGLAVDTFFSSNPLVAIV